MKWSHPLNALAFAFALLCLSLAASGCTKKGDGPNQIEGTGTAAIGDSAAPPAGSDVLTDGSSAGVPPSSVEPGGTEGAGTEGPTGGRSGEITAASGNTSSHSALLYDRFEGTTGVSERARPQAATGTLAAVRAARQGTFDRVVFEFADGSVPGYRAEYIDRPVRKCGSEVAVDLPGQAWLAVDLMPAQPRTVDGFLAVRNYSRIANLPVVKEHALVCEEEDRVRWVFGLEAPHAYRVLELTSPPRLVVDIKH